MSNISSDVKILLNNITNTENYELDKNDLALVDKFCKDTRVPTLNKCEDNPYSESDFVKVKTDSPEKLALIEEVVNAVIKYHMKSGPSSELYPDYRQLIVELIIVCSEYTNEQNPWNTKKSEIHASNSLNSLLKPCGSWNKSGCDILLGTKEIVDENLNEDSFKFDNILKLVLQFIVNNFNKSNFKNNPGLQQFYTWLLHSISVSIRLT